MELGIALPTSRRLASPANIVRIAQEAERLGYAAVWTYERLLRPMAELPSRTGGPPERIPKTYRLVYEPLETLSYVAAVTERIRLGTSVIDALLHPPVVLARRFATLDQFSGGRVIAGVGQGWMPQEFETANVPIGRIGAGMDEAVAAMRACWGPDPVEFAGRFYRIAPSEVNPKPVQERLPVLLGATTPAGWADRRRHQPDRLLRRGRPGAGHDLPRGGRGGWARPSRPTRGGTGECPVDPRATGGRPSVPRRVARPGRRGHGPPGAGRRRPGDDLQHGPARPRRRGRPHGGA